MTAITTQDLDARGSEIQSHAQLQGKCEASLGYTRDCLKQKQRQQQ
ncbi:mCG1041512 [Mus musculus]|nr:mCG1041512 [Mus musculus]